MYKTKYLFFLLFIPLLFTATGCKNNKPTDQVCFKDQCFFVEIASSADEQVKGLMNRNSLAKDQGMLFSYINSKKYPFWMLNMEFPIDIIWINKDKQVVYITENAQPCLDTKTCQLITPDQVAKYVLEVNAGIVSSSGLTIGDSIEIK